MGFEDAESKVRRIAERVAASSGLEVVEVELRGGAGKGGRILRVFIEKNKAERQKLAEHLKAATEEEDAVKLPSHVSVDQLAGITHDDLENFSRELSVILDVEDAIPGAAYTLEVSSPGLDRKLTGLADYQRFAGSLVKLSVRDPANGNRHLQARIKSVEDSKITLALDAKKTKPGKKAAADQVTLRFEDIVKAHLVPEI